MRPWIAARAISPSSAGFASLAAASTALAALAALPLPPMLAEGVAGGLAGHGRAGFGEQLHSSSSTWCRSWGGSASAFPAAASVFSKRQPHDVRVQRRDAGDAAKTLAQRAGLMSPVVSSRASVGARRWPSTRPSLIAAARRVGRQRVLARLLGREAQAQGERAISPSGRSASSSGSR